MFLWAAAFFAAKNRQPRRRRWRSCLFPGQDFIGFGQCHYSRFFQFCKKNRSSGFDKISAREKVGYIVGFGKRKAPRNLRSQVLFLGWRGWITQATHLKKPRRGFFARRNVKRRALRVALADFSATPWRGLEKSERCPSLASLCSPFCRYATSSPGRGKSLPQAAVGSAAVRIHPRFREAQDSGWQCVSRTFRLSFRQSLRSW